VKKFVQGHRDGAVGYENVTVEYIRGLPPVLTIFHDSEELEKVALSEMNFDEIHAMMAEKGFVKKPADLFDADGDLIVDDIEEDDDDDDDIYNGDDDDDDDDDDMIDDDDDDDDFIGDDDDYDDDDDDSTGLEDHGDEL